MGKYPDYRTAVLKVIFSSKPLVVIAVTYAIDSSGF